MNRIFHGYFRFLIFFFVFFPTLILAKGLEGTWQGILDVGLVKFRVALVIQKDRRGNLKALFNNIDDGLYNVPVTILSPKPEFFKARFKFGQALILELYPGNHHLVGTYYQTTGNFEEDGDTSPITLIQGHSYLVPRLDAGGQTVTGYQYRPPREGTPDWKYGGLPAGGVSLVETGICKILNGTFPHIHGIVAARGNQLLLDETFYGYGALDPHPVQSITKSVFSLLFGIAQDKGLVQTREKLYDFFPAYRTRKTWDPRKGQVTLGHLLSMTSGFDCSDWDDAQACSWGMVHSGDWLNFALSKPLAQEPGTHFAYCGACLLPLSVILEKAGGLTVPAFAQKVLFDPLQIHSAHWVKAHSGGTTVVPMSFGLSMAPRDLAKIGLLVLDKGKWDGKRIVPEDWIKESTSVKVPRDQTNHKYDYGYLWWETEFRVGSRNVKTVMGWGVGGNYLFIVPDLDLVCVVTGGNYNDSQAGKCSLELFQNYILPAFCGNP